jgi:hypothetical protein
MYEIAQGEDSPWYGYLQSLPFKEDLPVFWSEDEQDYLKGTEMEGALKNDMAGAFDLIVAVKYVLLTSYFDI